jgi:drug/metabolite transporter (DMT)-like permease
MIPMSLQLVICQTTPFWTSLIAFVMFSERAECFEIIAMLFCFTGVVGFAYGAPIGNPEAADAVSSSLKFYGGICLALISAWASAAINCGNRYLKDIHFSIVLFGHALFGLILAIIYFLTVRIVSGDPYEFYSGR